MKSVEGSSLFIYAKLIYSTGTMIDAVCYLNKNNFRFLYGLREFKNYKC